MLNINKVNADNSTEMYLNKINMLLDTYAPLKRINKYKLKFNSKPWITLGLQYLNENSSKTFLQSLIKKEYLTSYPLSALIRLLAQIVYLIIISSKKKMKFSSNCQIFPSHDFFFCTQNRKSSSGF